MASPTIQIKGMKLDHDPPHGTKARSILKDVQSWDEDRRRSLLSSLLIYHFMYTLRRPVSASVYDHEFTSYSSEFPRMCKKCYAHRELHER